MKSEERQTVAIATIVGIVVIAVFALMGDCAKHNVDNGHRWDYGVDPTSTGAMK